jgi:hypothetical protein
MLAFFKFLLNKYIHGHIRHLLIRGFNLLNSLLELFDILKLLVDKNLLINLSQITWHCANIYIGFF